MADGMNRSNRVLPFKSANTGFAYLWVLLLVALMGIGLTTGVEIYTTSVQRDKEKELLAIGRQFRVAIGRYTQVPIGDQQPAGKLAYPLSLDDLLQDNRSPAIKRHLRKIFIDPMTGKAEWGLIRVGGQIVGVHSLSTLKPIKQGNFEVDEIGFQGKEKYSGWVFIYPSDLLLHADTSSNLNKYGVSAMPQSQDKTQLDGYKRDNNP